ncbi:hypothetical protein [Sediminitomix flava]|uniref:Uncharacterized protein n=1 Tax=Sediminitomix flava TaxID=379075 RepID=A0A315ZZW7_SEDFL|nr:hypothetical protein [Sediminitomix flava]PWJ42927.1 hypothetical protein BC781_102473 [Sediminitomix flava]
MEEVSSIGGDVAEYGLQITYILFGLAVLGAFIIGPILNAINNPKALVKGLASAVFIGVLFAIAYSLADGSMILPKYKVYTESTSRLIGAGLITTYLMFGIAFLGIIITLLRSTFRKLGIG